MEPLLTLFAARLVMNDSRETALELAQQDLLYIHKIVSEGQAEMQRLQAGNSAGSPNPAQLSPVAPLEKPVPVQSVPAIPDSIALVSDSSELTLLTPAKSNLSNGELSLLLDEVLGPYKSAGSDIKSLIMKRILAKN